MNIRGGFLSVIFIFFTVSGPAVAQDCSTAAPPTTDGAIVIDARNGSFSGARRYGVGDQTRVLLINKNPFRFKYVLKVDEAIVEEDAIGKFLGFAGISVDPPAETPPTSPSATPPSGGAAPLPLCGAAVIAELTARNTELQTATEAVKTAVAAEIRRYNEFAADAKQKLLDPQAKGPELCETAKGVVAAIDSFGPASGPQTAITRLRTLIDAQNAAVARTLAPPACRLPATPPLKDVLDNAEEIIEWATKKLEELSDREDEIDELAAEVRKTLHRAEAFWEARPLGPHNVSTVAEISVTRTDTTVPDAKAEAIRPVVEVNFGAGKRFFLAGGIAASSADMTRFKTIDGFVLDRDGNAVKNADGTPKFGKVVGLEEESVGRVSPAVLLHGILWRPSGWVDGVGLSLGIGSAGSDETVLEFFAGSTVSFAEDHLFLTLGAFRGEESQLAGDFYVGAEVPSNATLSTVKRRAWTFGLGLTFRIP
jgi:hypothetical protein